MYDVGDGYSLSSPVTRNKFSDGSNTRFIVSSRNSVTKKKILDPHYKRHSYALSKKFTHYHVYHNKTKDNTYF